MFGSGFFYRRPSSFLKMDKLQTMLSVFFVPSEVESESGENLLLCIVYVDHDRSGDDDGDEYPHNKDSRGTPCLVNTVVDFSPLNSG
jgi:hypothetical protein